MSRKYDDWFFDNLDRLTEQFIKEQNVQGIEDHEEYIAKHYGAWEDWVWDKWLDSHGDAELGL